MTDQPEAGQASLRRALAAGEESGDATPFEKGEWLAEQEQLDESSGSPARLRQSQRH